MERFTTNKNDSRKMNNYYIGYAANPIIRKEATSGGIGSSILKYLFDNNIIQTSITFDFNDKTLSYEPRLIYKYDDYKITGSIYHEIPLIKFIKEKQSEIKGRFACFVLPCQAQAIRSILNKSNIQSFLIGLTCSSQQDIDATYYLLKRLHIQKENVQYIQYRGNGWPSGIQITLKNQKSQFIPNNTSIWSQIFHSRLFIQKRCFSCKNTFNNYSDIALADPWIKEYVNQEKIGQTIIICHTQKGNSILEKAKQETYISIRPIEEDIVLQSQAGTLRRKELYLNNYRLIQKISKIFLSKQYRSYIINSNILFIIHNKIKRFIETKLLK